MKSINKFNRYIRKLLPQFTVRCSLFSVLTWFQKVFALSLICVNLIPTKAQSIQGTAGKYGNFIYCGRLMPKENAVTKIYRNDEAIAKLNFPNTAEEFVSRVNQFYLYNNYYPAVDDSTLINYWQWATSFAYIDSLPVSMKQPDILYGLGVLYFDPLVDAINNKTIKYAVERNGRTKQELSITQPAAPSRAVVKVLKSMNGEKSLGVEWRYSNINDILTVKTFKEHVGQDKLHVFSGLYFIRNYRDSVVVKFMDTGIKQGLTYRYWILATDQLGYEYGQADTVKLTHKPMNTLPVILKTKTNSENEKQAISISWKLQHRELVQTLDIFRSLHFDSAYELIATVNNMDTFYIDYAVKPVTAYWYKIVINGLFERGLQSSRVTGILKKDEKPSVVNQFKSSIEKNGIKLIWTSPTSEARGFYVFRANGYNGELKQISELILIGEKQSVFEYLDSSSEINHGNPVSYAIKVLSNGYVLSDFSNRVSGIFAKPGNAIYISNLRAIAEDKKILVVWQNNSDKLSEIAGYVIYRKHASDKEYKFMSRITNEFNQFIDTGARIGQKYDYKVAVISFGNNEISYAKTDGEILAPAVLAPQIAAAIWENGEVKLSIAANNQEGVSEIEIYRIEEGQPSKKLATIPAASRAYSDKTANKGKVYFYYTMVSAFGKESQPSEAVKVVE